MNTQTKKTNILAIFLLSIMVSCSVFFAAFSKPPRVKAEELVDISSITGLQVHLDAQSITGLADGAKVSSVSNLATETLAGVGDASQSNIARQPKYIASGAVAQSKPVLRFDRNSCMKIGENGGFYLNDMTIFVVASFSELPQHGEILSRVATGDPYNHNWFFNVEGGKYNYGWSVKEGDHYAYPQYKTPISNDAPYIMAARKSANSGNVVLNGETVGAFVGGNPENNLTAPVALGAIKENDSFVGDIGEVLVYDRGLSDIEFSKVEQYLEARWGMLANHEGTLTDIKIKGKTIPLFKSAKTVYSVLVDGAMTKEDITFSKWYDSDTAVVTQNGSTYTIEVTGKTTNKKVKYIMETEKMNYDFNEIKQLSSNEVKLNDGYWSELYKQYSVHTVNYMFDMFDLSNSFDNFDRVAKGEKKTLSNTSEHAGEVRKPDNDRDVYNTSWSWISEPWREGLIYEGIRAASEFVMVNRANPEYAQSVADLTKRLDEYVTRIYSASLKTTARDGSGKPIDGYFSTSNILQRTHVIDETDVTARYHHDIYNYGCLTEAATYLYEATGDTRLLFASTRFTEFLIDYINGRDGYTGYKVVPPHQLPEEALQNLYLLYAENPNLVALMENRYSNVAGLDAGDRYYTLKIRLPEYKKIAASWISDRGNSTGRYNNTNFGAYAQDNVTYDKITEAQGHAVRANLWYNGIAYVGNKQENFSFVQAADGIWQNIVGSQMYVTGGTGSTNDGEEAYGGTNQLPHDGYCETCASVGMAYFSQNMFNIFGKAEYIDNVELEMYNGILGCLGMDGNSFYYTNPMVSNDYTRPMFSNATPCCVPMFLKYFSELPEIIYAKTADTVFVNQYISSSAQVKLGNVSATIIQKTDMPNGNNLLLAVNSSGSFNLKVRMPSWASGANITINGASSAAKVGTDGYIDTQVSGGEMNVSITFDKQVIRLHQDNATANKGMVSFKYGAFVYCAEEVDNFKFGDSSVLINTSLNIPASAKTEIVFNDTLLKIKIDGVNQTPFGINTLKIDAKVDDRNQKLTLVPFFARGNREKGHMNVWFKET